MLLCLLPSFVILGFASLAALRQTRTYRPLADSDGSRNRAAVTLAIAASIQAVHCTEEAFIHFPVQLAALLRLPAMPISFFLSFNLGWLAIWAASLPGLRSGRAAAVFAAWFPAIAGIINGVVHPLLAIASDAYFPGLVSSPFIGIGIGIEGILLWRKLKDVATLRALS